MTNDEKIDQLLKIIQEQGDRHDLRFAEIGDRFDQADARFNRLEEKIDRIYDSLSEDIQVFAVDLLRVKRRVTRLEKKPLS